LDSRPAVSKVDLTAVLSGIVGGVLVWASLKNKNPLAAVKLALSGGNPNDAPPFSSNTEPTPGPGLTDPGQPLEEYRNYDPNAPGLGGMPTI
jgi:hypothetical protein